MTACSICGQFVTDDYLCGIHRAEQWFPGHPEIRGMDFFGGGRWLLHVDVSTKWDFSTFTYDEVTDTFIGDQPPWVKNSTS